MKFGTAPRTLCPHFGPCGGCDRLDLPYAAQLQAKHAALVATFAKVPSLAGVEIPPVIPDPWPYFYRNKVLVPLAPGGTTNATRIRAGFYRRGSHDLIDIRECQIQEPALTELVNRTRSLAIEENLAPYDEKTGKGFLRALFFRLGVGTGEIQAGLVTRGGLFPNAKSVAQKIVKAAEGLKTRKGFRVQVVSVMRNIQDEKGNVLLGAKSVPLLGKDAIEDHLGRLTISISLPSFYQVNPLQAQAAYKLVEELAGETAKGRVIDAYGGIGSIACWLAKGAKEVIGLEEIPQAVRDAEKNAARNGFKNCRFIAGKAETTLGQLAAELKGGADLLVLDPPRQGCAKTVLEAAAKLAPRKIVYLSCAASTLARDLDFLLGHGYRLDAIRPIDFFPHTEHLEVLAALSSTSS